MVRFAFVDIVFSIVAIIGFGDVFSLERRLVFMSGITCFWRGIFNLFLIIGVWKKGIVVFFGNFS